VIPPLDNSDFVAHMESVLDVYKTPYDRKKPVVCMDESPKQLIGQTRIPIARKPGQDEKQDYEYSRQGVANIFLANENTWKMRVAYFMEILKDKNLYKE
jgi:hypothetical protein